jgi:hypothetical protein
LRQAATLDELHCEVRSAFDVTRLVHLHDVRVPQAGHRRGFPAKTPEFLGSGEGAREEHLDRDQAVQRGLSGLVDHPHAATAEHRLHLVTGNLWHAGGGRHGCNRAGLRRCPNPRNQRADLRVDAAELLPALPDFGEQLGAVAAHLLRRLARIEHLLEQAEHLWVTGHRQSSSRGGGVARRQFIRFGVRPPLPGIMRDGNGALTIEPVDRGKEQP